MRCPQQNGDVDVLLDYAAGRLSPAVCAAFEDHLRGCAECARFTAAQRELWPALDLWKAPEISPTFDERLYAKIDADRRETLWGRLRQYTVSWKPALAGATVAAAIAAALFMPQAAEKRSAPQREMTVRSEKLDAEQVERTLEDLEMLKQLSASNGGSPSSPTL